VLSGLQTFFGYAERGEKHRAAAAEYSAYYRELDLLAVRLRASPPSTVSALQDLTQVVRKIDRLQTESLDVPDSVYDRSRAEQESDSEGV